MHDLVTRLEYLWSYFPLRMKNVNLSTNEENKLETHNLATKIQNPKQNF